jgi:hypothetical protein
MSDTTKQSRIEIYCETSIHDLRASGPNDDGGTMLVAVSMPLAIGYADRIAIARSVATSYCDDHIGRRFEVGDVYADCPASATQHNIMAEDWFDLSDAMPEVAA